MNVTDEDPPEETTPEETTPESVPPECTVCTNPLDDSRTLPCGHAFCMECLDQMTEDQTILCPICRKPTILLQGQKAKDLPKKIPLSGFGQHIMDKHPRIVKGIKFPYAIRDVAFDEETQWLLVTTKDSEKPIQIFTYQGTRIGTMGKGVLSSARGVCLDTKRNQICVTTDTHIATMDSTGGYVSKMKKVGAEVPSGIAYNAEKDVYLITDIHKNCVTYFDPNSGELVKQIGLKGTGDKEFQCPGFVSTWGNKIAISDNSNHCVKLFDIDGEFLLKFGGRGRGSAQFEYPQGICCDRDGHFVVCDDTNQRVTRIEFDESCHKVAWRYVIPPGVLGGDGHFPYAIDVNDQGMMAVSTYTTLKTDPVDTLYILKGYYKE